MMTEEPDTFFNIVFICYKFKAWGFSFYEKKVSCSHSHITSQIADYLKDRSQSVYIPVAVKSPPFKGLLFQILGPYVE